MAQRQAEANNLMEAQGLLQGIFQLQPELTDRVDGDKMMKDVFADYALPADWLRSDEDVEGVRAQRAQMQQAQQEMEMVDQAAGAASSAADAGVLEAMTGIKKPGMK
jgi:hypothetical protein